MSGAVLTSGAAPPPSWHVAGQPASRPLGIICAFSSQSWQGLGLTSAQKASTAVKFRCRLQVWGTARLGRAWEQWACGHGIFPGKPGTSHWGTPDMC